MRLQWVLSICCLCMLMKGAVPTGAQVIQEASSLRAEIAPGETRTLVQLRQSGLLTGLTIAAEAADSLWLMAWWDGERSPSIEIPIRLLPRRDGRYELSVPAPFQRGMRLALRNTGDRPVSAVSEWQIEAVRSGPFERLKSAPYREPLWRVPAHDDILANLEGAGLLRMILLDRATKAPVWAAPDGASVGLQVNSMQPVQIPFRSSLRLYLPKPDAPGNDTVGGTALYMDRRAMRSVVTDRFQPGDLDDERRHDYTLQERRLLAVLNNREPFSTDRTDRPGRAHRGSSRFTLRVDPANRGVLLQVRSAPSTADRIARVTVNGLPVADEWVIPAVNRLDTWVDSVFYLPEALTRRRRQLEIGITVTPRSPEPDWSEHGYRAVCLFEQSRTSFVRVSKSDTASDQVRILRRSQPWGPEPTGAFQCRKLNDGTVVLVLYQAPGAIWRRPNEVTLAGVTAGSVDWWTPTGHMPMRRVSGPATEGWTQQESVTRLYLSDDQLKRLADSPLVFRLEQARFEPSVQDAVYRFDPSAVRWSGAPLHLPVPVGANAGRFTVEAWVKLHPHHTFQAIIAHGPKDARHWELFVYPGTNTLRLYAPGLQPVEVDTGSVVADERWHFISARVSSEALLIEVDGQVVLDRSVQGAIAPSDLPVTVGALMEEVIPVQGVLGELRLSAGWRPLGAVPSGPLTRDTETLLLVVADDELLH